ncbi:hypothetical protein KP509_22G015500 [Ceratopteris richardii]|uniref:Uncharacterized protein n=1 Tax=Ceratopteris richardii TaxID=49495 RepID=A0A8T2S4Z3_CERRI|nr:hypothetical protein KP509_22G015500 [Ceratopteris richardii]
MVVEYRERSMMFGGRGGRKRPSTKKGGQYVRRNGGSGDAKRRPIREEERRIGRRSPFFRAEEGRSPWQKGERGGTTLSRKVYDLWKGSRRLGGEVSLGRGRCADTSDLLRRAMREVLNIF